MEHSDIFSKEAAELMIDMHTELKSIVYEGKTIHILYIAEDKDALVSYKKEFVKEPDLKSGVSYMR